MANRPHIPEFGNWSEQQNVPYTMVFEGARNKRNGQSKIRNPNDPADGFPELSSDRRSPSPANRKPESEKQIAKERHERRMKNRERGEFKQFAESPARFNNEKSSRVKAPKQFAESPKQFAEPSKKQYRSPPAAAVQHPKHSSQGSGGSIGGTTQIPNVRGQDRVRAIPKFGSWGNNNGDGGYTMVFENLRREKSQDGGGRQIVGTANSTPSHPINQPRTSRPASPETCCFPWGGGNRKS